MTKEGAIIILTNTASFLRDGTRYFKPEHEKQFREAYEMAIKALEELEQRWSRLMMYLADLQLAYSPNWGANGCGDQKLYEFVTGLIDELQGWGEGEK